MKYAQFNQGRTFVLRLEDGETVHEEIENFAVEHAIRAAAVIIVGGADAESRLVVGPESGDARPVNPMDHVLKAAHEIAGTGTLFPDETGAPMLHMHMACGRRDSTVTGCIRNGVRVWQIMEVVIFELIGALGKRLLDEALGFKLLIP